MGLGISGSGLQKVVLFAPCRLAVLMGRTNMVAPHSLAQEVKFRAPTLYGTLTEGQSITPLVSPVVVTSLHSP